MRRTSLSLAVGILALTCLALPLQAHNGAVALAVPLHGIHVDGDLSDWPAHLHRYPIALTEYGVSPKNEADYKGWFRIGYDPQAAMLYVAVEMQDQSFVFDHTPARDWNTEDGCELYIDIVHGDHSAAVQHLLRGQGSSGPAARTGSELVTSRWRRNGNVQVYEWGISLRQLSVDQLKVPLSIGFDVVLCDRDADGSFSWMAWGKGNQKNAEPSRRGDVILVPDSASTGTLNGKVRWLDNRGPVSGRVLELRSTAYPDLRVFPKTASDGTYAVEVPAGPYTIGAAGSAGRQQGAKVQVIAGKVATLDIASRPGGGRVTPAGGGREVEARGVRQGQWSLIGAQDGLPNGYVAALSQSRKGYLWIGTQGGLSRYDGKHFLNFTAGDGLPDEDIRAIAEDRSGNLWIGTGQGLVRYDGRSFLHFTTSDGLVDNDVLALLEDRNGALWIGTSGGLSRYEAGRFVNFAAEEGLTQNRVSDLAEDGAGVLWAAGGSLCRYDGHGRFQRVTEGDLADAEVHTLKADRRGGLWIGTERGLVQYDGRRFTRYGNNKWLPFPDVWGVLEDQTGGLWTATAPVEMDPPHTITRCDGKRWAEFSNTLGREAVQVLLEDREGNVWIGTTNKLARYDAGEFLRFTTREGLVSDTVRNLAEDRQGNLWITTDKGLSRFDGEHFTNFQSVNGFPLAKLRKVVLDRADNLWIGSDGNGLFRFDGHEFQRYSIESELQDNRSNPLLADRDGNIWIGTNSSGLFRFDGKSFTRFTTADRLDSNSVNAMEQRTDGSLWVSAWESGVMRFDGSNPMRLNQGNGLPHNRASQMRADREGRLWVAMQQGGLCLWDGKQVVRFTTKNGLAHDNVNEIAEDARGILWAATSGGLSQYDGFAFQNLLRRDGLPNDSVSTVLPDRNGQIWIGMQNSGIIRYRPHQAAPPVVITDVVTDRRHGWVRSIGLPTTQSLIAFEFQGISFRTSPDAMLYRYRLGGHDEQWQVTSERRVEYPNLPRGNYVFEVQAIDRDLSYSVAPAQVAVEVHWPYAGIVFWGAMAVVLFLAGLLILQIVRYGRDAERARRIAEAANRSKSEFLANMSHEIRTPMNGIIGMTHLALAQETNPAQVESLGVIQSSAKSLLNLLNEILDLSKIEAGKMRISVAPFHVIEPVRDTCRTLSAAAKQKGITLEWAAAAGLPRFVEGDAGRIRQVLLNLVGNAIKFTLRGGVRVDLSCGEWVENRTDLHLSVSDTGIGICPDQQKRIFEAFQQADGPMAERAGGTGLGLTISGQLALLMGGRIEVESSPGKGSTFHFYVPVGRPADQEAAVGEDNPGPAAACARSLAILVAEDNPVNQRVAQSLLAQRGHQVTVVGNGSLAVAAVAERRFDLILMDVQMPTMDGWEATRRIREQESATGSRVRIIGLTAHALQEAMDGCREAGMDDVVLKPFDPDVLFAKVEQLSGDSLSTNEQRIPSV